MGTATHLLNSKMAYYDHTSAANTLRFTNTYAIDMDLRNLGVTNLPTFYDVM